MINYTVYYKLPSQLFWRKLKNVKADILMENKDIRVFVLENEERVEVPTDHIFKFSRERFYAISKTEKEHVGMK